MRELFFLFVAIIGIVHASGDGDEDADIATDLP